jgi:hypothetical protein
MKNGNGLIILVAVLAAIFCAIYVSNKIQAHYKIPNILQTFEDAHISVTAPAMQKNIQGEQAAKNALKNQNAEVAFYKAKNNGIEYSVVYVKNSVEASLPGAIGSIVNTFTNYDLKYTATNNEVQGNEGVLFEGTFTKDDIEFAIKEQLIKKSTALWQIIVIMPSTPKNNIIAKDYINSVNILQD